MEIWTWTCWIWVSILSQKSYQIERRGEEREVLADSRPVTAEYDPAWHGVHASAVVAPPDKASHINIELETAITCKLTNMYRLLNACHWTAKKQV